MKQLLRPLENILTAPYKRRRAMKQLARFEHKQGLFSALNEEIILQQLIAQYKPKSIYVDIGASDGVKWSNTARLALNQWQGVCFEYDPQKIASMAQTYRSLNNVSICRAKVMPTNIIDFFKAFNLPRDLGVVSLDIDSYDYFVLETLFLSGYRPSIVLTELNILIPPPLKFTILFHENFWWAVDEMQGYSLSLLEELCQKYNYALVHLEWNNAFIVAKEHAPKLNLTAVQAFEKFLLQNKVQKEWMEYDYSVAKKLYQMAPRESLAYFEERFKERKGTYSLTY